MKVANEDIKIIFLARVYFELFPDTSQRDWRVFNEAFPPGLDMHTQYSGGPCCYPYVEIVADDLDTLKAQLQHAIRTLKKRKAYRKG